MSDELKTPLKLTESRWDGYRSAAAIIRDADNNFIASLSTITPQVRAIVHRVNCHDKLVEALERAELFISQSGHSDNCYVDYENRCICGLPEVEQQIEDALELAKGGTQ